MKLSVVIPARNEEGSVGKTVTETIDALVREGVDYEIVVVDDGSSGRTAAVVEELAADDPPHPHPAIRGLSPQAQRSLR